MRINEADVAELVDARDLKSRVTTDDAQHSCKLDAFGPAETAGNPASLQTRFKPQINPDWRIVHELLLVRARAAKGDLPAFRRGRMFFDFHLNKVRFFDPMAYRLDGTQGWQG